MAKHIIVEQALSMIVWMTQLLIESFTDHQTDTPPDLKIAIETCHQLEVTSLAPGLIRQLLGTEHCKTEVTGTYLLIGHCRHYHTGENTMIWILWMN
jgi:hypothetical protein